jgi:hypothetical protein
MNDTARCYGTEMKETKVLKIWKQPSPIQITDKKPRENIEHCSYFGSNIINDTRRTREMKFRIAMKKTAPNKKII